MSIRKLAKENGVRCIGLGQMIVELGGLSAIKADCEKFRGRFPGGQAAMYDGQPVTGIDMIFDEKTFPFYRIRIVSGDLETRVVPFDDRFRWL